TDIIHPNSKYNDLVNIYYYEQEITYEFIVPEIANEHEEPFYKSWKNEYNNRLYRVSDLEYQALAVTDEKNYLLGTVVNKNYEIIELNDQWHLYYKNSKTLEDIAAELKEDGESVLATELEELIAEKNKMLNAFYH